LDQIHEAAKAEFLQKGYKDASLRNIVKSVGMTTGAFYGYYKSKEELFEAIVGEHYRIYSQPFYKGTAGVCRTTSCQQPEVMSDISGLLYVRYAPLCV
jgi:AcrR family transcriptional regulator